MKSRNMKTCRKLIGFAGIGLCALFLCGCVTCPAPSSGSRDVITQVSVKEYLTTDLTADLGKDLHAVEVGKKNE